MSTATKTVSPVTGLASSLSDVAGDLIEMGELHIRLVRIDARSAFRESARPFSFLLIGISMMMASLPIFVFAIAGLIESAWSWSPWFAQLVTSLCVILLASAMIALSMWRLKSALAVFQRSSQELTRNVAWLKSMVRGESI